MQSDRPMEERIAHHYRGGEFNYSNRLIFLRETRLYQSIDLGSLSIEPRVAEVASSIEARLEFTVGSRSIPSGSTLRLFIVGFNPLGNLTDADDEATPRGVDAARIRCLLPPGVTGTLEIVSIFNRRDVSVVLAGNDLTEGQTVAFVLGEDKSLTVSEVARPVTFHLELIEPDGSLSLIDRAVLEVTPGPVETVECVSDPTGIAGIAQPIRILLRDHYGNLVPEAAEIDITTPPGELTQLEPGDDGCRRFDDAFTPAGPGTIRIEGVETRRGIKVVSTPVRCVASEPEERLYFGDLHAHDYLSPGLVPPTEYYHHAEIAGYHFVALPIQSQSRNVDPEKWVISRAAVEDHYRPGKFVTFLSFEWQHYAFGHKNVLFLNPDQPYLCPYDERYDSPEKLFAALRQSDAVCLPHHVGYRLDCHVPGTDWEYVDEAVQPVMEICSCHGANERPDGEQPLNAPGREGFFQDVLARGIHIGVIGGSDSHSGWPVTSPREPRPYPGGLSCIYAKELSRRGLIEALRARRCYATTGARIVLDFGLNDLQIGAIGRTKEPRNLTAEISGTDTISRIEIIRNGEIIATSSPGTLDASIDVTDSPSGQTEDWYYLKVVQRDGEIAWSSPIWVQR